MERIKNYRAQEGLSIHALAKRHGVHRRAVRQALDSPIPPKKRHTARRIAQLIEVGRLRRSHLVPVPNTRSIEDLNNVLDRCIIKDHSRTITGKRATVGELLTQQRARSGPG